jgi:hypothetical protein
MIVSAPESRPHPAEDAERTPIQANLCQRRPHQRADEHQVAAVFGAKQFCGLAELTDGNPMMAKALHPYRIAGASQREKHGIDAARGQGIRYRKRHDAACRDQADR